MRQAALRLRGGRISAVILRRQRGVGLSWGEGAGRRLALDGLRLTRAERSGVRLLLVGRRVVVRREFGGEISRADRRLLLLLDVRLVGGGGGRLRVVVEHG